MIRALALLLTLATSLAFEPVKLQIEAAGHDGKAALTLKGAEARRQLLVTATDSAGATSDLTSKSTFEISALEIVKIAKGGLLIPLSDGECKIKTKAANGVSAELKVKVSDVKVEAAINFANQITPIFT